jgi:hypothetical protein
MFCSFITFIAAMPLKPGPMMQMVRSLARGPILYQWQKAEQA